jgi:uncharacterized protein with ParB-like and HNH nuclease domain
MTDIEKDEIKRDQEEDNVDDEAELDETAAPIKYKITSFGADYDVEGLIKRLDRNDIYIPPFQRSFVWNQKQSSKFIESLLLGLPVPGIFLARDNDTKRLLVIDGQQRLKSMQFFYDGFFNPQQGAEEKIVFKLLDVQKRWEGKTYETIEDCDRITFRDTIIHATIVQQESPEEQLEPGVYDSSIYYIFERLNTTGRKLSPQQIRVAIYHGKLLDTLKEVNEYKPWRKIFGVKSKTLKDQEMILRFLALYFNLEKYGDTEDTETMKGFLNEFSSKNKDKEKAFYDQCLSLFQNTIDIVTKTVGEKSFRLERALNVAVFDAVMLGIAKRLQKGKIENTELLVSRYSELLKDKDFITTVTRSTSNKNSVKTRCSKAISIFSDI